MERLENKKPKNSAESSLDPDGEVFVDITETADFDGVIILGSLPSRMSEAAKKKPQ